MPIPPEYQRASLDFNKFLLDTREASGLATTNQVYTMVQGLTSPRFKKTRILKRCYAAV